MNTITITRLFSTPHQTIGTLSIDENPICWSLEPPWKMNKKAESCILPGVYFYKHYDSPRFARKCIQLLDVHKREYVSMHPGNTHKDTKACILPGMSIGTLNNATSVMQSSKAIDLIISKTNSIGKIKIIERF
ncbi:MAG: hypothetical protein GY714_20200 [Desulfobacterales bacterium]|nr:hypothetical protein [Desulfobacterales bacterium]